MNGYSIVLLGGPSSGKTNYMCRLWLALKSRRAELTAPRNPKDIKYVEDGAAHLLTGAFAPRSNKNSLPRDLTLEIPVKATGAPEGTEILISVPDVSGELWKEAIERGDVSREWMETLQEASGALLFVRALSEENVVPLDWVNSFAMLSWRSGDPPVSHFKEVPTQVALCEMLRFLDETLLRRNGERPRVAVLVTAWDHVDKHRQSEGPGKYLKEEFPLFWGRLNDCTGLEARPFGVSVVGGDFLDNDFLLAFREGEFSKMGFVVVDDPASGSVEISDVTKPVAWVLEPLLKNE